MDKIKLAGKDEEYLKAFVKKGRRSARQLTRAYVLLLLNDGKTEVEVKGTLWISRATVSNIKRRYRKGGLQGALTEKSRPGQPRKYSERQQAEIIAQACSKPPHGRKRWSLLLLTEEMKKKKGLETINRESIRLILKKAELNLG
jgi:transposase